MQPKPVQIPRKARGQYPVKLTKKQKTFCEAYLRTGNASAAAREAGYKQAASQGSENLQKPYILAYLNSRIEKADRKMIADTDEVLAFYTAAMRGCVQDGDYPPGLTDRLRAADALMRRLQVVEARKALLAEDDSNAGVVILPPVAGGGDDA